MILTTILFPAVAIVLAIYALSKISTLEHKVWQLGQELAKLKAAGPAAEAKPADAAAPLAEAPTAAAEKLGKRKTAKAEGPTPEAPQAAPPIAQEPQSAAAMAKAAAPAKSRDVEQALASRWFVWIGGAAIGVAGLLFVKYASENNLIPPFLWIVLGLALGAALVWLGERIRQSRAAGVVDYVPAALSAGGLITCFGSVYGAYAVFDLISATVAFVGLGLVGLSAFWLSARQGPLIAALGLIGSYAAPALVTSSSPNAYGLFPYLVVIIGASFATLRGRTWWWLGYLSLAGASAWALLWLFGQGFSAGELPVISLFALAMGGIATLGLVGRKVFAAEQGNLSAPQAMSQPLLLATFGMALSGLVLAVQVFESHHDFWALLSFMIGMALIAGFSWMKQGFSYAAAAAALASLLVIGLWPEVSLQSWAMDENGMWTTVPGLIEPYLFRNWMLLALAGFTALGALGYLRKDPPHIWAGIAAGSAFLFLFVLWGRLDFVFSNNIWTVLALVLAAVLGALIYLRRGKLGESSVYAASSILVVGVALLLLFAADRLFDGVWLTLSLGALALGFAALSRSLVLRMVGWVSSAFGSLAAIRLFVMRELWTSSDALPLGAHWPVLAYGGTAVLLFAASRIVNPILPRAKAALEGISLGLAVALISLELRVFIAGGVSTDHVTLLEMAAHFAAWAGAAYGLAYRQSLFSNFISKWGSRVLLAAASFGFVVVNLLLLNPLLTGDAVEGGRIFNSLWLAYLAPVGLIALIAPKLEGLGWAQLRNGFAVLALVLFMTFVSLMVKVWFEGQHIELGGESDAESYSLSLAWLVCAGGLFVAGINMARKSVRLGGLVVMALTVLKVFLVDLSDLGGLWRIASLLGLGLCLVGMGWLYTRYVKQADEKEAKS
jgi:uncharacterized membrane protein